MKTIDPALALIALLALVIVGFAFLEVGHHTNEANLAAAGLFSLLAAAQAAPAIPVAATTAVTGQTAPFIIPVGMCIRAEV